MSSQPLDEEAIFQAARAIAGREARCRFLEEACAGDDALKQRVNGLLAEHDQLGSFLEASPAAVATIERTATQRAGMRIGRYKLLEQIGEGGMGSVWVAEQTEPVRRKVALKLIKAGMDSKSVLARFEAERQALAVMDHPNIAKVLDGGLTDVGRPFFVMEYVKGVPITEYCDATRLSVPERLNLFVQVCHAVQHAHQKGIIHRDLKPSNILVAPYDDKPVPKVIDFGLAKAMHQPLTERTLHTAHETALGTPLYMSPEQAQLNNLDVDTRSDIYSLGVLLYELLTGTTPLEKQRFKEAAWDEVRRIIREEDPPRPSTRLSSINTLPSLAAGRQIEPTRLTKLVRGELDWIVMKSLEKDRGRRYETANGFATDIQRYLSGEPVLAAPPSARYRLRKFARKHRMALTTAAAIILLLAGGVALSTWQAVRAMRAEAAARLAAQDALKSQRAEVERAEGERTAKLDAEAKRIEAERQQSRAEAGEKLASERLVQVDAEKQKAEEEKQIAQAVLGFLQNKLLRQADVRSQADTLLRTGGLEAVTEAKPNPTIRELLDRAAKELTPETIDANFPKQPQLQAEILQTVGDTYRGVGEYERAISFLERSAALWRQHLGPDDPRMFTATNTLALAYQRAGKLDLALPLLEETLKLQKAKLGPDHSRMLVAMSNLANAYQAARKVDLALPLYEETLKLAKVKLGTDHRSTFTSMHNLAGAYRAARKLDLALPLYEEALKLQKAKLGPDHPETLTGMNNLAVAYFSAGKLDLAVPLFEDTLKVWKAKLGPDHPETLTTMSNLADAYRAAKMPDLAATLHEETLRLRKAKLGADHSQTLQSISRLAVAYHTAKKLDLALPLYQETLQLMEAKFGHEHPDTLTVMSNLAGAYRAAGKFDAALRLYAEVFEVRKSKLGPEHAETQASMNVLAGAYQNTAGKLDQSNMLYEELIELRKAQLGSEHSLTLGNMWTLVGGYREARDFNRAIPLIEELWSIRKRILPQGDQTRINTQNQLGLILLLAGRFEEAEPHLLASYRDGAGATSFPKDWSKNYALRLICLYAEWGKPSELDQWQTELNRLGGTADSYLVPTGIAPSPANFPATIYVGGTAAQMLRASRFRAAEFLLRDCLANREKALPDHWATFYAKSLLGGALLGLKNHADAEPLLLAGYEGIKKREANIPPLSKVHLSETLDRLVDLYTAMDKPDDVKKWQVERSKYSPSGNRE